MINLARVGGAQRPGTCRIPAGAGILYKLGSLVSCTLTASCCVVGRTEQLAGRIVGPCSSLGPTLPRPPVESRALPCAPGIRPALPFPGPVTLQARCLTSGPVLTVSPR